MGSHVWLIRGLEALARSPVLIQSYLGMVCICIVVAFGSSDVSCNHVQLQHVARISRHTHKSMDEKQVPGKSRGTMCTGEEWVVDGRQGYER